MSGIRNCIFICLFLIAIYSLVSAIPWQLKIHPSAMYHFGLTGNTESHDFLHAKYSFADDAKVSESVVVVSAGVGSSAKRPVSFETLKTSIVSSLREAHPSDHISHLFPVKSGSVHAEALPASAVSWIEYRDALLQAKREDPASANAECSFDGLEFVDAGGSLHIRNLDTVHGQAEKALRQIQDVSAPVQSARSCLASLLAALASNRHVIDVRLRAPLRLLNANAKAIIQSGASNGNYPYHSKGLTGVSQVAGVADSGIMLKTKPHQAYTSYASFVFQLLGYYQ
jgi:hypothetical protein